MTARYSYAGAATRAFAAAFCASLAGISFAQDLPKPPPPDIPKFAPLAGTTGYQEIKLSTDSWYVAFHGTRMHGLELIDAGWAARAAQLCMSVQRPYFVRLRYVGEPVLTGDRTSSRSATRDGHFYQVGTVYVPIFIPRHSGPLAPVLTPSRLGAIRCINSPDSLIDRSRAVSVTDALATARKLGFTIP